MLNNCPETWYEITNCKGSNGKCPHAVLDSAKLEEGIRTLLAATFSSTIPGDRKDSFFMPHERLRIGIACCPNACSQPQIRDIGLIARCTMLERAEVSICTQCNQCAIACRERAIAQEDNYRIDSALCVGCSDCFLVCKAGARLVDKKEWTVIVGGRLGRHPHLAEELVLCDTSEAAVAVVKQCLHWFVAHKKGAERFSETFSRRGMSLIINNRGKQ